jgi:dihydrolipoamide dehydrogenase
MPDTQFDVIIVGAGPGGYVGAIRASQLGLKTALVEANYLGGICLNWGCIPTKALLRSAEIYEYMKQAANFGLGAKEIIFNLPKVVERSRAVSRQLSGGVAYLLKKNKVTLFDGYGKLLGCGKLAVERDDNVFASLSSKHIIIATGARAKVFPGLEPDGKQVWTYREALVPKEIPHSLLVIGSGAIGVEFASFFHTFGADVTIVEALDNIMPMEDAEISKFARKQMEKRGLKFKTSTVVKKLDKAADGVTAILEKDDKQQTIKVDKVITAVGVVPNVENIGLEAAGVKLDQHGFISIDGYCKTSTDGVYAIGDVAGAPCLAHKASQEAIICVERIAGVENVHPLDKELLSSCTYCEPQVASVGLTEKAAKEKGYKVNIGRFPFSGNGKAIALGASEGLVKTVFEKKTGELLGAHMVGADVTELIQGFGIAKTLETTDEDLIHTIFPHPTLSEMMHESVLNACSSAIHV